MADRDALDGLPARAKALLRKRAQPKWVALMLATLTDERFSREGWLFEPKWDGERCLVFRRGRQLSLFSRNRIRLNEKFPELTAAFHRQQTDSFIADGEIVTFKDGITSFAKLQERMQVEHRQPICSAGSWYGCIFSICFIWATTTPGEFRSGIASKCFAIPSTLRVHCGLRNIARQRSKPTIERHVAMDGRA